MDFGNLTHGQKTIARKIAAKAREMGIDPELALAVGWAESGFANKTNPDSGALGPMQVMPSNAAGLKIKVSDLRNVDSNIDAGMRILKENLERYNGDERLAVIAYNWRPSKTDAWAKNPDESKLPSETQGYIQKINTFRPLPGMQVAAQAQQDPYGPSGALPAHLVDATPPAASAAAPAASGEGEADPYASSTTLPAHLNDDAAPPPKPGEREHMGETYNKVVRPYISNPDTGELDPTVAHAVGMGAGALLGAAEQGAPVIRRGVRQMGKTLADDIASSVSKTTQGTAAAKPTTGDLTSGEKWGKKTGFGPGIGGPETVEEQAAAGNRAKGQGKVSGRQTKMWGTKKPGEPNSLIDRMIERSRKAEQAAAVEKEAIKRAALEAKLAQYGGAAYKTLSHIPGLSVLGGYLAGDQAMDALKALEEEKYGKAAIQGLGALGSAAALIPHPVARIGGAGLSALSVPAQAVYDYLYPDAAPAK